jgi:hypothetical protein
MVIGGQHFSQYTIDRIQQTLDDEPSISQLELSRRVCQWLEWRSPNGRLQDMSCRKALARLDQLDLVKLPRPNRSYSFEKPATQTIEPVVANARCTLDQLGQISVEPVSSRYCSDSKVWFALLDRYHYLGSGPLCGAQIRYIVKSSIYGYLGGLAVSSAAWALADRDKYIGWTEAARRANLQQLVGNSRFLILPTIQVANLASHVLALTLARLPDDWEQRYGVRPVMVETFVDPTRFDGTCYRAANWQQVGYTAGRRDGVAKRIFVYPLDRQWQKKLCVEPSIMLGQAPRVQDPAHWAEEEFGTVCLYDDRLKQRLYTIAQDFYNAPQSNIPEACGSKGGTMGAYRFFQNPKVSMDIVIDAHCEATIDRIREHRIVLAPQDTTTLNYTTHPMTTGLGPVNTTADGNIGVLLHDTLAFTEDGTPLGVLDAQCWARDPDDPQKSKRRYELPIEQKESYKWLRSLQKVAQVQALCPDTLLVSIGDRESDIYELFEVAQHTPHAPGLLVRSEKSRNRKIDQGFLWDVMAYKDVAGSLQIHVPRSGSRKARDTWVDIRFAKVSLKRPKRNSTSMPAIDIWAVYVLERPGQASVKSPIEWMLLTTVAVNSFADAQQRVQWYSGRWGIEVYHRTLKSGCRIKDRQLGTADRLETCLGVDMVVAWRIYHLTMLGREVPDAACTVFFKDIEWKALCCYVNKTPVPPETPPTLKEAIYMIASMGGHLGRKSDGFPGPQTLWRGLQRLDTATEMFVIFSHQNPNSMQSGP